MQLLKALNDGLAFFLELAMLAAFVYWGFKLPVGWPLRILAGVGVPALMIAIWAYGLAPNNSYRFSLPLLVIIKVVIFGAAAYGLYASGKASWGYWLGGLTAVNLFLAALWHRL